MKTYFYLWNVLFILLLLSKTSFTHDASSISQQQKKIIVLTNKSGSGHETACTVLKQVLPDFNVKIINPYEEITHSFNFLKTITCGRVDAEKFYTSMIQHGWFRTANFLIRHIMPFFFHIKNTKYENDFFHLLEHEKPVLFISTMPVYSYPAMCAAHRYGIPFLLITLDADLTCWLHDFELCSNYNFIITIGTKTPRLTAQLANKKIPEEKIRVVGHPIKQDFFEPKNLEKIRTEWHIPKNKFVIMLMRGGTGFYKLIDYAKALKNSHSPLHLLVCTGKNTSLIPELQKLSTQGPVSLSIIPFTNRISDLMAISDLIITQPSPTVCNEAMQSHLPILVDMSDTCLFWEASTIDWIKARHGGTVFTKTSELEALSLQYLNKKNASKQIIPASQNFQKSIRSIICEMVGKASTAPAKVNNKTCVSQYCSSNPNLPA